MADLEPTVEINGKLYPSRYPPGTHWATDAAWEIVDTLTDLYGNDVLAPDERFMLAGMIAGRLMKERREAGYAGAFFNPSNRPKT